MKHLGRYTIIFAAAFAALALVACSSDNDNPVAPSDTPTVHADPPVGTDKVLQVAPGDAFQLAVGESARLGQDGVRVEFLSVSEDSRCPTDVQCIQAGRAVLLLDVDGQEVSLIQGTPNVANAGEHVLEATALDPYPVSTDDPEEREYVATLVLRDASAGPGPGEPADGDGTAFRCCAPGYKWAPIETIEIVVAESFPPQYFLTIVSGLPNGCAKFDNTYVQRVDDTTIVVQVINSVPTDPDIACTEEYRTVEKRVALGSRFDSGATYTVNVNDKVETFVAQ